jgi:hypothetical protein
MKINFLFITSIVLFILINVSLAQAGIFKVKVYHAEYCPRQGAYVRIYNTSYPPTPPYNPIGFCFVTDETGYCQTTTPMGPNKLYKANATWPGGIELYGETYFTTDEYGDINGIATIRNSSWPYPNGTEACGDSECDGFKYCYGDDPKYIECDSWDTECDTKKCCQCNGGVLANPTENYDETQDEDCNPFDIATCFNIPDAYDFTWDYRDSYCTALDTCYQGTITHTCDQPTCDAECDEDSDCGDYCVGDISYNGDCDLASTCTCSWSTEDCNSYDGCYAYDTGCEDRNYFCTSGNCNYNWQNRNIDSHDSPELYCAANQIRNRTRFHDWYCEDFCTDHESWVNDHLEEDCDAYDNYYDTGNTRWISTGECTEKEEKEQIWEEWSCNSTLPVHCSYYNTTTRWIDTGNTRNKDDGTPCNDGLYCTDPDNCTEGVCGGPVRDCSDNLFCTVNDHCDEDLDACVYDDRDCSANDITGIATCDNIPDNILFTWDYRESFTSVCDEGLDICTTGNETITHTCDKTQCGAECETDDDCPTGELCGADCTCGLWEQIYTGEGGYPIVDIEDYNGKLYFAQSNGKLHIYDGSIWTVINNTPYIISMQAYEDVNDNKLYWAGGGEKIYSYDGSTWIEVFDPGNTYFIVYMKMLGVYDGKLWAGNLLSNDSKIYYCDGSVDDCDVSTNWHEDTGFSEIFTCPPPFCSISSMGVYNGKMYIGAVGKIYVYDDVNGWENLSDFPTDVYSYMEMKVYNNKLYLATRDQPTRCPSYQGYIGFCGRVLEYDGINWTTSFDYIGGWNNSYWIFSLEKYNNRLYAGTDGKIYMYDGSTWELSLEKIFDTVPGKSFSDSYTTPCMTLKTWNNRIYAGWGNGIIFKDDMIIPKPDLIIEDIWTSGNRVYYKIKNQGNENARYSYSRLYVDDYYRMYDYVPSLSAGYSRNEYFYYSWYYTWSCSGSSDTIEVCADGWAYVNESDEKNNCRTEIIKCPESIKIEIQSPKSCMNYGTCTEGYYYKEKIPLEFIVEPNPDWIGYSLNEQPYVTITGSTILNKTELIDKSLNSVTVFARKGSVEASQRIEFFYCLGDMNYDRTIDISDAIFISRLYGTYCGDGRYNNRADINDDCRINMLDISLVSREFGKTCS